MQEQRADTTKTATATATATVTATVLVLLLLIACAGDGQPGAAAGGAAPEAAIQADLAIEGVVLLDPEVETASSPSTVLIAGDRIVAVGPQGEVLIPEGTRRIDGAGRFLLPGLWDLHTHLTFLGDGTPTLLVVHGVTGVRDLGGVSEEVEALRGRVLAGELIGPTVVRTGPTLNGAPNGAHHRVIESAEAARQAVAELHAAGVDLLKTHNQTSREAYFALLEAASAAELTVAGHVPVTVTPLEACEAGQASVEHIVTFFEGTYLNAFEKEEDAFAGMSTWVDEELDDLARCFAAQDTLFVPTLRAYELRAHRAAWFDDPDPRLRYLAPEVRERWLTSASVTETDRRPEVIAARESLVEIGMTVVRRLHAAGVLIGAGTDIAGPGLLPGIDLHAEIRLLAKAGLTPREALQAATRGPGARAGGDPLQGRLVAGAPADLVLLRADAFNDLAALDTIDGVVLRGRHLDRALLDAMLAGLEEEDPGISSSLH